MQEIYSTNFPSGFEIINHGERIQSFRTNISLTDESIKFKKHLLTKEIL
jgi:hypothetical protein